MGGTTLMGRGVKWWGSTGEHFLGGGGFLAWSGKDSERRGHWSWILGEQEVPGKGQEGVGGMFHSVQRQGGVQDH